MKIFTKKSWIVFAIAFLLSFMMQAKVHAQESSNSAAAKYGVTFPIVELGNCATKNDCRTYCEDPLNRDACVSYAKQKGFYREQKNAVKNSIAISAKQELGCEGEETCKSFCSAQENWEKCGDFAKKHNLGPKKDDSSKKEVLIRAKEVLGCESTDSCKDFCTKEENQQKCNEFAKLVGLKGGVEKKGPGGCNSLDSCKAFCALAENFQICSGFAQSQGAQFKGPGGCSSEEDCKEKLKEQPPVKKPQFSPSEYCSKTPNCKWTGERCECKAFLLSPRPTNSNTEEYDRFCKEFPDKCPVTKPYSPPPSYSPYPKPSYSPYTQPTYTPKPEINYEAYCKEKGCTWSNNTCQCSVTASIAPAPISSPTTTNIDPTINKAF